MEDMSVKKYYVESIKKLPKKWEYNHTLLEINENIEDKEKMTLFRMSYFPYFNSIFVVDYSSVFNMAKSQIIGFPEYRGILKGEGKEYSLSNIMRSRFFLTLPKELVEEFTKKYYELYDLLVKNEYELEKIPVKNDFGKKDKAEYYFLRNILLSSDESPLKNFFRENEIKGLFIDDENLLSALEYKKFSNSGSFNSVRLHKDENNDFHIVIYFRDCQFSIPLGYTNKMIREILIDKMGGLFSPFEDMVLMYYKCLQFKEYIEYYNLCEDLSIYEFPKVSFIKERDIFTLAIGELYYVQIKPVIYNLEFYFKVSISSHMLVNILKYKLIDFFMDQNSLIHLIAYLLNRDGHYENSLIQNVSKLVKYIKRNVFGDEFGEWKFEDAVDYWKKLLKNFIEIRYDKDNKKYMYRRYKESEVVDIELDNYNFSDLLINVINPDGIEDSYEIRQIRKITRNEDIKDYPENLTKMKELLDFREKPKSFLNKIN